MFFCLCGWIYFYSALIPIFLVESVYFVVFCGGMCFLWFLLICVSVIGFADLTWASAMPGAIKAERCYDKKLFSIFFSKNGWFHEIVGFTTKIEAPLCLYMTVVNDAKGRK